jgi:stearoyl-CoA desaturase (delta-9 desaturase)
MALLTFGEGYHNYHHEFQHDYRNGVKPWQWDPTKWTIWTLSKLGLAEGLRRVPDSKILLAEMREARMRAELHLAALEPHGPAHRAAEAVHQMLERLTANYHELEKAASDRVHISREALNRWQNETRAMVRELHRMVDTLPVVVPG